MKNALHRKFSVLAVTLLLGVLGESAASPIVRQGQIKGPQRGALVLAGGGRTIEEVQKRFVALAGGQSGHLVVIPSGLPPERLIASELVRLKNRESEIFGIPDVTVLHAKDRAEANAKEFVKPLQRATAVWILGGDETQLAKLYVGTLTEREIKAVADRNGVLGGTSAGAMILAQFVGDPKKGDTNPFTKKISAFGLLTNVIILPHWSERDLRAKAIDWLTQHPGVLIIGIDETAAVVIAGSRLEVMGSGHIGLYDGKTHEGQPYRMLAGGQVLDLKTISIN